MADAMQCDLCGKFSVPASFHKIALPKMEFKVAEGSGNYSATSTLEVGRCEPRDICRSCAEEIGCLFAKLRGRQ